MMSLQYVFLAIYFIFKQQYFINKCNVYSGGPPTHNHIDRLFVEVMLLNTIQSRNIPNAKVAILSDSYQLIRVAIKTDVFDDLSIQRSFPKSDFIMYNLVLLLGVFRNRKFINISTFSSTKNEFFSNT